MSFHSKNSKIWTFCGTHGLTWCSENRAATCMWKGTPPILSTLLLPFCSFTPNTQNHQTMELESAPFSSSHWTVELRSPPSSNSPNHGAWITSILIHSPNPEALIASILVHSNPTPMERKEKPSPETQWKGKKREKNNNNRNQTEKPNMNKKKKRRERWSYDVWLGKKEEQRKSKNKAKKKKSSNEREESYCGVGWHGFDNSQNIGPVSWVKLRKCHCNSISITQKHLFFFFSLSLTHNSIWWVLGDGNKKNENSLHAWDPPMLSDEFRVMNYRKHKIQTPPQWLAFATLPKVQNNPPGPPRTMTNRFPKNNKIKNPPQPQIECPYKC